MASKRSSGPLEEFTRRPAFRIAVRCPDLAAARRFYEDTLGCRLVTGNAEEMVLDFFTCRLHLTRGAGPDAASSANFEFGLETGWEDWHRAVDHLNYVGVDYASPPVIRDRGTPQESAHFALADPGGNRLGFTAQREPARSEKQGA